MAYASQHSDILCSEDIDALRVVFERFCETHQRTRSDDDMEIFANMMIRMYQSGQRDTAILMKTCEDALSSGTQHYG